MAANKVKKNELALEQSKRILEDITLLNACDKKQRELDKRFKALEAEQKKLENERSEIEKRRDSDMPAVCKYVVRNMNKRSANSQDREKRKVLSGMYRPKPVPDEVVEFMNKIIKNKKLPTETLDKELEYYPNQVTEDGKVTLGEPVKFKVKDFTKDKHISQHAMSNIICRYLQHNELYASPDNKKLYKPDDDILKILKLKDKEELSFESFQKRIKRIYQTNTETSEEESEEESSSSEEEQETPKAEVVKKLSANSRTKKVPVNA